LPPECPMPMTVHRQRPESKSTPHLAPMRSRRLAILAGTALLTSAGCYEMYEVLEIGGVTVLEATILVLFVLLFAWIAISFVSAIAGFCVLLLRKKETLGIDP